MAKFMSLVRPAPDTMKTEVEGLADDDALVDIGPSALGISLASLRTTISTLAAP